MPRRKSLILFTVVIATVALLLAANQAGAFSPPNQQCPEGEMTAGECDVDGGYMVEIVPCCVGVNCQFPCYLGTETKFEYKITATGNQKIDNFDLLVATACPQDAAPPSIVRSNPGGMLYTDGGGSPRKFGRGLSGHNVYSVEYNKKSGTVSLYVAGNRTAAINDLGLIISSDYRKWARMQVLLPGCDAPERTQTGAVPTAKCVDVSVPDGENLTRIVSYRVQKDPQGCDVDDINQIAFFALDDCAGDPLDDTVRTPPPGGEDGDHTSYCGSLETSCPECVDVRFSCNGNYCVDYTTNSGAKVQQCVTSGGTECDWEDDRCDDVFDETLVNPCNGDLG